MPRRVTQHYQAEPTTRFAWATDDNDKFNRELDLYHLSQAVENHDHSNGRGKPVGASAIGANTVDGSAIKASSITSTHIVDGTIQRVDLANGIIDNSKLDAPRVKNSGDTMTGDLTLTRAMTNTGQLNFGVGDQFIQFDGTKFVWQSNTGVPNWHIGDLTIFRKGPDTHQGAIRFNNNGEHILLWNGTSLLFRNFRVMTEETHVSIPVGGILMVESMAVMNGLASTGKWARDTRFDGRMPVGNGATVWGYYVDGADSPLTTWAYTGGGVSTQGFRTIDAAGNPTVYLTPHYRVVVFAPEDKLMADEERQTMKGWGQKLSPEDVPQTLEEAQTTAGLVMADRLHEMHTTLQNIHDTMLRLERWIEQTSPSYQRMLRDQQAIHALRTGGVKVT